MKKFRVTYLDPYPGDRLRHASVDVERPLDATPASVAHELQQTGLFDPMDPTRIRTLFFVIIAVEEIVS